MITNSPAPGRPPDRTATRAPGLAGFNLLEVLVSAVILGTVATAYGGLSSATLSQQMAAETITVASEIASRQLEWLRAHNTSTDPTCPFTSDFQGPACPSTGSPGVPYTSTFQLKSAQPRNAFLTDANSFAMAFNTGWMVGDGSSAITPAELVLPPELGPTAKNYSVRVHVARVRTNPSPPAPNDQNSSISFYESLLIHYQVEVYQNNTPVLVIPYLQEVQLP